jgi:hypothetical protein
MLGVGGLACRLVIGAAELVPESLPAGDLRAARRGLQLAPLAAARAVGLFFWVEAARLGDADAGPAAGQHQVFVSVGEDGCVYALHPEDRDLPREYIGRLPLG